MWKETFPFSWLQITQNEAWILIRNSTLRIILSKILNLDYRNARIRYVLEFYESVKNALCFCEMIDESKTSKKTRKLLQFRDMVEQFTSIFLSFSLSLPLTITDVHARTHARTLTYIGPF